MKTILVTGGAGFIGSHTCVLLLGCGYNLIILDSFINSKESVIKKVINLSGIENLENKIKIFKGDIRDFGLLNKIFNVSKKENKPIDAVIHFAGLKSVENSIRSPLSYWDVNVCGTINLIKVMEIYKCFTIIFSSSATIYGIPEVLPLKEISAMKPFNTYGFTKATIEKIFYDMANLNENKWKIATLRYFNPVGAHPSGLIGEEPLAEPKNLFPYICQVALGKRNELKIFGKDWDTSDGSGVRDYIHIMDLASAHLASLIFLNDSKPRLINLNIGTGKGISVLEVVKTFEMVNKVKVPYSFSERREGDIAIYYADNNKAISLLNWEPKYNLKDMCRDSWKWQKLNP